MTDRTKIIERIRMLRERTVDRGFTEAEAMTAAELLGRLTAEHDISMTDVEIGEERCQQQWVETGHRGAHESRFCTNAIASYCNVRCFSSARPGADKRVSFYGLPIDVENAAFLLRTVIGAMDRSLLEWRRRARSVGDETGRSAGHSFLMGMAARISERLREIKANERASTAKATGRDLVVVKGAIVAAAYKDFLCAQGIRLKRPNNNTSIRDGGAFDAGRSAGDRVGFNRGVGHSGGTLAIGRD